MNYITGSSFSDDRGMNVENPTFSYTMKFPNDYKGSLEVTKFEKNLEFGGVGRTKILTYKFINVYPLAVSSMPVSYNTSRLLKCSVGMAYTRYFVTKGTTGKVKPLLKNPPDFLAPFEAEAEAFNNNLKNNPELKQFLSVDFSAEK